LAMPRDCDAIGPITADRARRRRIDPPFHEIRHKQAITPRQRLPCEAAASEMRLSTDHKGDIKPVGSPAAANDAKAARRER